MAIWIAKLLGPVIVALAIPMMVTPRTLQETTRRFLADSPTTTRVLWACLGAGRYSTATRPDERGSLRRAPDHLPEQGRYEHPGERARNLA